MYFDKFSYIFPKLTEEKKEKRKESRNTKIVEIHNKGSTLTLGELKEPSSFKFKTKISGGGDRGGVNPLLKSSSLSQNKRLCNGLFF